MLRTLIVDPRTMAALRIDPNGSLITTTNFPELPSIGTINRYRFFSRYLTSNGEKNGQNQMNVVGTLASPINYYLEAEENADIYVMRICILIADNNIAHNTFGQLSPLVNGWSLHMEEEGDINYFIENAKTSGHLIAHSGFENAFGTAGDAWELTAWATNDDAHMVTIPVSSFIPGGLRIGRGGVNKLVATVKDNLTGLSEFWVKIFGYKHYPSSI